MSNKLIYIANIRLPTEKAHGIQIMEMCAAFAKQGLNVELIVPKRKNEIKEDPFVYHDIPKLFTIKYLNCLDVARFGRLGLLVQTFSFSISVLFFSFTKRAIFYTRDPLVAIVLRLSGKKISWEGHQGEKNLLITLLIKLHVKFVLITEGLKELYLPMGLKEKDIFVAPDGADIDRFNISITKKEAREKLNLPIDKKVILYKGHLFAWKGPGTLAQAMCHVKDKNAVAVFIGGSKADVDDFKKEYGNESNIMILGNRPRQETPVYQKAADVLIIPNSAKEDISKLYTSPMKLFGYMAGDRPIITSDLPSLREILDESLAYFFIADDPESLANRIDEVLLSYTDAENKAHKALKLAEEYSWDKRAQNIINFVQ